MGVDSRGNNVCRMIAVTAVSFVMLLSVLVLAPDSALGAAWAEMTLDKQSYRPTESIGVTSRWSGCSYKPLFYDPNVCWEVLGTSPVVGWTPSPMAGSGTNDHTLYAGDFTYGWHTIKMDYAYAAHGSGPSGWYDYRSLTVDFFVEERGDVAVALGSGDHWEGFAPNDDAMVNQTIVKTATGAQFYSGVDTTMVDVGANIRQINVDSYNTPTVSMILQTHATARLQLSYDMNSRAIDGDPQGGTYYETFFDTGPGPQWPNIWKEIRSLSNWKDGSTLDDDSGFKINLMQDVYSDFRMLYWGKWYDSLYVSSNGFVIPTSWEEYARNPCPYDLDTWNTLKPDETDVNQILNPVSIPDVDGVDGVIAPLWADLDIDRSGRIYWGWIDYPYEQPHENGDLQSFVVAWDGIAEQCGTGDLWATHSFAVIFQFDGLAGTNGGLDNIWWRSISFLYGDVNVFSQGRYVVGVENQEGTKGLTFPWYNLVDEWVVKFTPDEFTGYAIKTIELEVQKGFGQDQSSEIRLYGPGAAEPPPAGAPLATGYNLVNIDQATVNQWHDEQTRALWKGVRHVGDTLYQAGKLASGQGIFGPLTPTGRAYAVVKGLADPILAYNDFKYALRELPFPASDGLSLGVAGDTKVFLSMYTLDYGLPHDVNRPTYPYLDSYSAYDCVLCTRLEWKVTSLQSPQTLRIRAIATASDNMHVFDDETVDTSATSGWLEVVLKPSTAREIANGPYGHWWYGRTIEDGHHYEFGNGITETIPGQGSTQYFFLDRQNSPSSDTGYSLVAWNHLTTAMGMDYHVDRSHPLVHVHGSFLKWDSDPMNLYIIRRSGPVDLTDPDLLYLDFLGNLAGVMKKDVLVGSEAPTNTWVTVDKTVDLSEFTSQLGSEERILLKVGIGMDVVDTSKTYYFRLANVDVHTESAPLHVQGNAVPSSGPAPLAVQYSCTVDGGSGPYSFTWDFGDDTTANVQNPPEHTYGFAGTYLATVTVTDSENQVQWSTQVTVDLSVTGTASPTSGYSPLNVDFSSTVVGATGQCYYSWAFGDGGTSTDANPSHEYSSAGTYTATVVVADSASHSAQQTISTIVVSEPPFSVEGTAMPTSGQEPLRVEFTCTPHGGVEPYTYSWQFGDGTTSSDRNPVHFYSYSGSVSYTATVTVTDSSLPALTAPWSSPDITVSAAPNQAPTASFAGQASGLVGQPLRYDGSISYDPDGTISEYKWDFGDGNVQSGSGTPGVVLHTYSNSGTYQVSLSVRDDDLEWSLPKTIQVAATQHVLASDDFADSNLVGWTTVKTGGSVLVDTGSGMLVKPSMKIYKQKTSGESSAKMSFPLITDGGIVTEAKLSLSTKASNKWCDFELYSGTTMKAAVGFIDGYVKYYSGSSWVSTSVSYDASPNWYEVRMVVSLSGDYDIFLNGDRIAADIPLLGAAAGVDAVKYKAGVGASQNGVTLWVDDVSVKRGQLSMSDSFSDSNLGDWWLTQNQGTVTVDTGAGKWVAPSMRLAKASASGEVSATYTFGSPTETSYAIVEGRMMVDTNANNKWVYFCAMSGGDYLAFVVFKDQRMLYSGNPQTGTVDLGSYSPSMWYAIRLDVWLQAGRCDVYIDGVKKVTAALLYDGIDGPHSMDSVKVICGNYPDYGVTAWVDDVTVITDSRIGLLHVDTVPFTHCYILVDGVPAGIASVDLTRYCEGVHVLTFVGWPPSVFPPATLFEIRRGYVTSFVVDTATGTISAPVYTPM